MYCIVIYTSLLLERVDSEKIIAYKDNGRYNGREYLDKMHKKGKIGNTAIKKTVDKKCRIFYI